MSRMTRRRRRGPVLVLVTLLLAAGAFVLWNRSGDPAPAAVGTPTPAPSATAPSVSEPSASEPSVSPPSGSASEDAPSEDAEESAGEGTGEDVAPIPPQPAPPASAGDEPADGPEPVAVSLTYTGYDASAAAVVAGGYADGVVEEDATCTLVLRRDGVELRGESLGPANATTTDCGEVRVGGVALTSGTWEAVLSYTSATSVGTSAASEVVVP